METRHKRASIRMPARVATRLDRSLARAADRTTSAQIAGLLRQRIVTGLYPGGSQLLQDAIAAEFGVSKIPIREALVQLSAEGLVDIQAHRGFQVRAMSLAEAREVLALRLMIEPSICAEGARLAHDEDRLQARTALEALNRRVADRAHDDAGEFNRDFHIALAVPRLQPIASEVLRRLLTISQRYAEAHLTVPGRPARVIEEHTEIHRAWEAGRDRDVGQLLRMHIEETRDDLVELLTHGG